MLSSEETDEIKKKIIEQIESTFPQEQIDSAREQIESMNSEQLENFLKRNKLIKEGGEESANECVFCSIASGKINSVVIDEDEKAVAVLDINPISKGHALIIPKSHEGGDKDVSELAKKVSEKIKNKLKPKKVVISKSKLFGHEIINLLPVYKDENFNSEKKPSRLEDLEKIKEEINAEKKKKEKILKPKLEKIKENLWLPKRIP